MLRKPSCKHWQGATSRRAESFHVVSPAALFTFLRGYAESMASWFGREPRLALRAVGRMASIRSREGDARE